MMGFLPERRDRAPKPDGGMMPRDAALEELAVFHSFRSAPAQKVRPAPVTMAQRRSGSLSNQVKRASSSQCEGMLMQLSEVGRLKVTRRMYCSGKEMTA